MEGTEEIRVTGWQELIDCLYEESWQEGLGRFRSPYVFRGMSDTGYHLATSLARLGGTRAIEAHMIRAFQRYAYRPELAGYSIWNWLALGQHHGLDTRLLDWSYSPFVAMHFATAGLEKYDRDGAIWAVNHQRTNDMLPNRLKGILKKEGTDVFTAEMLEEAADSLDQFDALSDDVFVAFFEPPAIDERIVNQYALFSLVSDPTVRLDTWLCEHPDVYRRIIVPAELKMEIRDKLDNANITERVLYPGIDGLALWLNRYYMRRGD